jgi:hypothetical protein
MKGKVIKQKTGQVAGQVETWIAGRALMAA